MCQEMLRLEAVSILVKVERSALNWHPAYSMGTVGLSERSQARGVDIVLKRKVPGLVITNRNYQIKLAGVLEGLVSNSKLIL